MKKKILLIPISITTMLVAMSSIIILNSCAEENMFHIPKKSVYYWRTRFDLNKREKEFLKQYEIERIYLRFFDVDINTNKNYIDECTPVASLDFLPASDDFKYIDSIGIDIVPVVFITPNAIRKHQTFTDDLAHRLHAMCQRMSISINEVQFDCDWTQSTSGDYFVFLKEERETLKKYFEKDIAISSTIRFHQLAQTPPEVDYGVLMCYNTGNFKDFNTKNSILNIDDIKPYLKYLKSYKLPLALALPTYSWFVEFNANKEFLRLNKYDSAYIDSKLKHIAGNIYEVSNSFQGQSIKYTRYEHVSSETILQAKDLIEDKCGSLPIILYHLDSKQLSKYNNDEINSFFN